jgi:hypothetical protein
MDELEQLRIEYPETQRVDLADWGIEEVEPGICENTYENRRLIRDQKATYIPVYRTNGDETNLIQVISTEMLVARAQLTKEDLLVDHRNINSDYKTGIELILTPGIENICPLWVVAATKQWRVIEKKREENPRANPRVASAPTRCRATRMDGNRCMMWCGGRVDEDGLCKVHIRSHHSDENYAANIQTRSRNRLLSASIAATETLEELLHATSEPVRAQAAKEILDRSGIRAGMEIEVKGEIEHKPAKSILEERLALLAVAAQKEAQDAADRMSDEIVLDVLPTEAATEEPK